MRLAVGLSALLAVVGWGVYLARFAAVGVRESLAFFATLAGWCRGVRLVVALGAWYDTSKIALAVLKNSFLCVCACVCFVAVCIARLSRGAVVPALRMYCPGCPGSLRMYCVGCSEAPRLYCVSCPGGILRGCRSGTSLVLPRLFRRCFSNMCVLCLYSTRQLTAYQTWLADYFFK